MTQRNALLRQMREGHRDAGGELAYWDEQLARTGGYIMARRFWAVAELAGRSDEIQRALTGEQERLRLEYQSSVLERLGLAKEPAMHDGTPDGALLNEEIWAERVRAALQLSRSEERGRAVTVVGPHRDDLRFLLNGVDATVYGSRGQQRTVALALKLAEVGLMDAHNGEMPVLLLDDVASELDTRRARYLLDTVSRAQQVLITTTDLRDYGAAFVSEAMLWRVVAGTLTPAP
jgi:DNA replication and repair protein RecF